MHPLLFPQPLHSSLALIVSTCADFAVILKRNQNNRHACIMSDFIKYSNCQNLWKLAYECAEPVFVARYWCLWTKLKINENKMKIKKGKRENTTNQHTMSTYTAICTTRVCSMKFWGIFSTLGQCERNIVNSLAPGFGHRDFSWCG